MFYLKVNPVRYKPEDDMSFKEKQENPQYKLIGGYYYSITLKEACAIAFADLTDDQKDSIRAIPNFDSAIFEEITGLKL